MCFDGNARHAVAHRSAQTNKCLAKWRTSLGSWFPRKLLEHREIYNVAGSSVWTKGESSERQDLELKCENGGKRDWCEAVPVDGNGSVVETLAQNWTPLDREVQHVCADSHQSTSALLGKARGQNGLLGDLREGLEMSGTSVVEMATALLERSGERQVGRTASETIQNSADGRTLCRPRCPKSVVCRWVCRICTAVTAPGELKVWWWLRLASRGDEWWQRMASNEDEWLRMVASSGLDGWTQEGTDVESPSGVLVALCQRTDR